MDLNKLYFQHQLATMKAVAANDPSEQAFRQDRADCYGRQIAGHQVGLSATAASTWISLSAFSKTNLPDLHL